jgi:hypothetical protein
MLVGLFGSFFLKKYMTQMYKIKRHFGFNSTSNSIKTGHKKRASINRGPFICCLRNISFLKFQHDGFGYDLLQYR